MISKKRIGLFTTIATTSLIIANPGRGMNQGNGCGRGCGIEQCRPNFRPQDGRGQGIGRGRRVNQGNGRADGSGPYHDGTGPKCRK